MEKQDRVSNKNDGKPGKETGDSGKRIMKRPMDSGRFSRRLFDIAPDGIVIADDKGFYLDSNQAFCEMLGISYEELIGKNVDDFLTPEERKRMGEEFISKMRKHGHAKLDFAALHKDGTPIPIELTSISFLDDGKTVVLTIVHDLRDRKKKEEELVASEERYRILAENIMEGVIVIQDGRIKFANNFVVSLFGYGSTKEVVDQDLGTVFNQDIKNYFEQGPSSEDIFVTQDRSKDGWEFWLEARDKIITWEGKPAILATLRDVTESKLKQIAIEEERDSLFRENITLRSTMKDRYRLGDIVGKSSAMQNVYDLILKAGASDVGVAIYGESGTGKELIARSIHQLSTRKDKTFVAVNCGAIPEALFESEFFGHRKGAFTGAHRDKKGFFDFAHEGTLFLDEVGELAANNQVKLLRALDGGGYKPVGGDHVKKTDVRVVAATNRDLTKMIKKGLMREDFFYRIHIIPINVPPLRDRKEDIPLLLDYFMELFKSEKKIEMLPLKILEAMYNYDWPGNIRELQNVLQRYITIGQIDFVDITEPQPVGINQAFVELDQTDKGLRSILDKFEKQYLTKCLEQNRWHRGKTSSMLKLPAKTLYRKMKKHQLI